MSEEPAAAAIADRVREALDSADLAAFADLLDPAVRWGAPDDMEHGCHNRKQVLDWYKRGRDAGTRARVIEVVPNGDKILVGLHVTGTPDADESEHDRSGDEANRWQVLTVAHGRVVDIRGFDDRNEAAVRVGLPT